MLGYVLTLATIEAWWNLREVLINRLSKQERISLAFIALASLDHEDAKLTASAALHCTNRLSPKEQQKGDTHLTG